MQRPVGVLINEPKKAGAHGTGALSAVETSGSNTTLRHAPNTGEKENEFLPSR